METTQENILTVEQLIARLQTVKDKTLPVYTWDSMAQLALPITDTDLAISDRVDLHLSHTAVDSNFVTTLVNYLKPLPEGSMYALAESEFTLETGGTCKGFGKKDGIAVLVMGKDSFYPVSKMDKADIEFMFVTTTLSQHLERGNFIVMAIEDCQQNEPITHD
jgi:hypothetical protein